MSTFAVLKIGFAGIGLLLLSGALVLAARTAVFLYSAIEADGNVVELREAAATKANIYVPVVAFATARGENITIVSRFGSSAPDYSTGDRVTVFYHPDNPESALIGDFMSLWGGALILGVVGGVLFAIGGGLLLAGSLGKGPDQYLQLR